MSVTPYCQPLFQNRQDLYQFLLSCQQVALEKQQTQLISISLEIDPIDPLVILQRFASPQDLSFYFERRDPQGDFPDNKVAIAAIGAVVQLQVEGRDRFQKAQEFIQANLARTISAGKLDHSLSGPHFFCNFTFFEHSLNHQSLFSAATIFLPRWQISYHANHAILVINLSLQPHSFLQPVVEELWQQIQGIRSTRYEFLSTTLNYQDWFQTKDRRATHHFKQSVTSALRSISAGELSKIVLAHAVDVYSPLPFNPSDSLHNLRRLYPDCHIFAVSNGQGQQFIGASPERLVSLRDRWLVTDALAGSAPRGKSPWEDAQFADKLLTNQKELHEHQVVVDCITRQLIHLGMAPERSPLRLLQLSNIQHLHTPIRAAMTGNTALLDVVATLHPTPAVAGTPRQIACDHIRRYEKFERSLYAAPIGWVDHRGNGEFWVGIRSALLNGCHACLFAGAGIVAGSDPNRELAEVQLKLQALLAALV